MAELERESQMFKNCFGGLKNHLCDNDGDDDGDVGEGIEDGMMIVRGRIT